MRTFARITAVVLMLLGVLLIVAALVAGAAGIIRSGMQSAGVIPRLGTARPAAPGLGLIILIFSIIQGVVLVAFGEVIFLMSDIVRNTRSFISPAPSQ